MFVLSLLAVASANGGSAGSIPDSAMTGGPAPGGVVVVGTPSIEGRVKAAALDEAIAPGLSGIRYCYQRQLQKQPSLAGEIVVELVIGTDGAATATTKSSTLGAPEVESCVNARFTHLAFPHPKGGQPATVTWPFTFAPPAPR